VINNQACIDCARTLR